MSIRCTTHFVMGKEDNKPEAIVYRHTDGYPEEAGMDLLEFLEQCGKLKHPRFTDPSYLAAKYVVFLADKFNFKYRGPEFEQVRAESKLDFLSVGICREDPLDIEYRYVVDSGEFVDGRPKVTCYEVQCDDSHGPVKWITNEVPIPVPV